MIGVLLKHLGEDGPGDNIAGQHLIYKALSGAVAQKRPVAT